MTLRISNLPWNMCKIELIKTLSRTLDSHVRSAKVIYDRSSGLSKGIAFVKLDSQEATMDLLRRGSIRIEDREVSVTRMDRFKKSEQTSGVQSANRLEEL